MCKSKQTNSIQIAYIRDNLLQYYPLNRVPYFSFDYIKRQGRNRRHRKRGIFAYLAIFVAALLVFADASANKASVKLTNGDRLSGEIIERTDEDVVMQHPGLGKLVIPLDKIDQTSLDRLNAMPKQAGLPKKATTTTEDGIQPLKKPGSKALALVNDVIFPGWKRHISAGLAGSNGNSDTLDVSTAMGSKVEDDKRRWELSSTYFFGRTDGTTVKSRLNNLVTRDWLLSGSAWFASVHGRYEFSKFEDWDHRFGLFAGPGYQFIKTEEFSLLSRLGAGVTRTLGAENDEWSPELYFGLDGSWALNDYNRIEAKTQVFPNVGDLGEFRAIASLGWVTDISEDGAFKLNLGVRDEYNSESTADAKNNDLDYYARFGYDF